MAILEKKASAMNLSLARDVIELLANKVSRNVRKLEGALTRIASYVSITHAPVNTDLVSHILRDLFDEENIEITVETVQRRTCSHFHISYEDIIGKKRPASIAFPRQIAMYLCRIMTSLSLSEIGEAFGGRDHGTVIHACKTVENAIEQDPAMKQTIDSLQNAIKRCVR
jgi:chromosomal replication initiator protein